MKAKRTYSNGLILDRWGNYVLRYRTGGRGSREVWKKLGPVTYDEAKTQAAILRGKAKARRTTADPMLTFGTLADLYLEERTGRLSTRGLALAEMAIRCHLKPFFGATRVDAMRAADVERYHEARRCFVGKGKKKRLSEKPIAAATFNREWSLLRAILNFGERTERIERNPIRRGAVSLMPTSPRASFFEPKEWKLFIETAAAGSADLAATVPYWRALLLTGRRIGELVSLRWSDVDFERSVARFYQTKTGKPVTLPLGAGLTELLKALSRFRKIEKDAPVFLESGGAPMTIPFVQVSFRRIIRIAKLETAEHGKLTPHSVRHTAATWSRRQGVPLDRIAAVLGHADLRMTMKTYAHIRPEDLSAGLDVLEGIEKGARELNEEKTASQ